MVGVRGEFKMLPGATMTLHFRLGMVDDAKRLVSVFHYSHRFPANVQKVGTFHLDGGLFGDCGEAIAACVFSIPPTRWSETVWELSRLVRGKTEVPLSRLVSMTAKRCNCDLLVSFADAQQGHHGGIYQACSWNYHGQRESRMDGVMMGDTFVPGRSANSLWGTRSPKLLAERGVAVEPHYDIGKHLYWRAFGKSGQQKAERLKLQSISYPKPARTTDGLNP